MPNKKGYKGKKRKGKRKNNNKKQPLSKAQVRAVKQIAQKLDDGETEFKYTYVGAYKYDGETTNSEGSFWKDNTGMVKTMSPVIEKGTDHDQRIGTQVQLRRIMLQYVLRWPLLSLTPNWNSRNSTASANSQLYGKDFRNTLEGRLYLIQFNHGDQGYAAFQKYLDCFKTPYTLRENMSMASRAMKKQEVKVLASKKFILRRHISNIDSTNTGIVLAPPVEGVLQANLSEELTFDSSNNNSQNVRFGYILKFGHLADQFLTITSAYNPLVQTKMHYWYTDE